MNMLSGFLFARPLDVAATEAFLANWSPKVAPSVLVPPPPS